ncbi:chemotaxis protein CheB [Candidatus Propionivibrio aalborgensis]|uniref:chemotaxis protein CheB n=1 Tax=Candidatus Propionivibrio aalborgensis TaxID=1860101 RepID=UPI000A708A30|nr:chemotaxis protein CheB [Candidatus Propionivibrio aalborgensis]
MATKSPPSNANSKGVARPESGRPSLASPSAEMDNEQEATVAAFPIVGIGCSAGGLSALEKFFANSPADSGMAFVIVQHLAPAHVSALPELLQRTTRMPVLEAEDGMRVEPDNVYVIPPNHDLSLLHDTLHLLGPLEQRGLRLPIDFFLKTLAADRKDKAIGVILSGMGSDGMFGLRAIKEQAGLTLAQEPASASADSMPNGVINAGLVDIIAIPEELPARIIGFLGHPVLARQPKSAAEAATQSDIEKIVVLLRERSGNDFSLYKTNTLLRRIERRIALHQLSNIASYVHYLRENPQEVDLLFKELLIGVTTFFRDPVVWETLRSTVLPALLAQQPTGKTLRAWVPACSSGEEAYTLAMTFKETLEQGEQDKHFELLIYATDLDPDAVEKARSGRYPTNIAADVSPERLARYFVEEANGYRIRKEIREMVVFAPQNIISDPPFTKLDVLSCRNLLIYFRAQLQQKLLPLFHYALNPDGLLILGSAETVGNLSHRFEPVDNKLRIFRRLNQPLPQSEVEFPAGKARGTHQPAETPLSVHVENIGQLTDQLIQQNYAPAAVLVNGDGDILYISGRTGRYLEPAAGKFNMNIHAMARDGLREALTGVIQKALRTPQPICLNGLQVGTNGGTQIVNVTVQALEKPGPLRGRVIIVFRDMEPPPPRRKGRRAVVSDTHEALVQELQQTREALQVTHEEMQTSVEEMKSSNEELQSTNEELQSTNEELTTSKEEMQSLNEELQTVNAELQSKVANLSWEQNDMANLLNSTEIATVFLDKAMKLRRFTAHATHLFKLIPGDVGRPLSDVVTDLDYPKLKADAQEVLNTLAFQEKEVDTHDGRCYRVRIMPYRTQEDVIDGVVITFTDISELKKLQEELGRRARK